MVEIKFGDPMLDVVILMVVAIVGWVICETSRGK